VLTALLAVAAVGGALAYRAAARDRSYRALLASGEAALASDDTLAAIEDFSGAIAVRPDAMLARLRRGETYRQRRDLELAARDFRAAAALDPTATRPLEALADVLVAQERFRRAAETYEARLRLDDRSATVRYKLALAHYRDGAVDAALADARRAVALDSQLADAYYLAGLCLRDKGQTDQAVEALEQAVERSPGSIAAREELADLYAAARRPREQLEQLQAIARLDAGRPERQIDIALAEAHAGKTDVAILTLQNALESTRDPSPVNAALGRVWLQVAEDHHDDRTAIAKALEALERASSAVTATSETKTLYGRAQALAGQLEASEQLFLQAIERYPIDTSALRQLAAVATQLHHAQVARTALVQYVALVQPDPDFSTHAATIGALSLQLNDPSSAVSWLQRATADKPDDVAVLRLMAQAELATGDMEKARATLTRALALDPANAQLLALRRTLSREERR
jgi:tetratricopeptide (TPR) repeat protein